MQDEARRELECTICLEIPQFPIQGNLFFLRTYAWASADFFPGGEGRTYFLPKKHTIFLKKVQKHTIFGRPWPCPLRTPMNICTYKPVLSMLPHDSLKRKKLKSVCQGVKLNLGKLLNNNYCFKFFLSGNLILLVFIGS